MAESNSNDIDSLSVIPYDNNREVVLRHADSIVVFDPDSQQLILRNRGRDINPRSPTRGGCPTCGRPYAHDFSSAVEDDSETAEQPTFINHEYFRMLARSLPGSDQSSTPPSPRRRLAQPVRSRLASPPMIPPPGAEFVGSAPAPPDQGHGISETAFTPHYFEKFFVIEKELGRGGRGVVLLVKHILDGVSLGRFACKRVPIGDDHAWLEKVLVEVQALQALSHQNLVSYRHVWLEDYQINNFGPTVPCAFILQQFCNGGDMHSYVCGPAQITASTQELKEGIRRRSKGETEMPRKLNEPKRLNFDEIYSFFRDITDGIRFLHLNGFIHRDLKPSNCLLHTVGSETRVLVSDFGEVQYEYAARKSTGATGTISYCAPEVLRPESPGGPLGNFTFKSDIFSLGMILHFLCFVNLPYYSADVLHEEREDVDRLRAEILSWSGFDDRRKARPDLPTKLYTFLKQLLSLNPENRPTADDVLNGIKFGGLDAIPDPRRRNSASPEELTPGKRIQKLDSPAPGNSPNRGSAQDGDKQTHTRQLRRRPKADRSSSLDTNLRRVSNSAIEDDEGVSGSSSMQRSSSAGIDPPIIFRRKPTVSSPIPSPTEPRSPDLDRRPQLLLPGPQRGHLEPARDFLYTRVSSLNIHVGIFAFKLITVLQPCMSKGMNPVFLYPLLGVAAAELSLTPEPMWQMLLLLALHITVLWYTISTGMLCQNEWHV